MKANEIKCHLFIHGIDKGHTWWIEHVDSELSSMFSNYKDEGGYQNDEINVGLDDWLEDMVHDGEDNFIEWPYILDSLLIDAKKPFVSKLY